MPKSVDLTRLTMNDSVPSTTQLLQLIGGNTTEMSVLMRSNLSLDVNSTAVKTQLTLYDVLIPSIGGVIILFNLLVVISSGLILKKGQQPRATYLFLGNVAMTDLMTGVAVVFGQLYPKEHRDHNICALQIGMIVASTLTSVYSVGLIAIDRFLYIVHGLQYQQWVYPTRARLLILGTWIIGCIIGFMPLFGWYGETDNGRICWFIYLAPKGLILLTVIFGMIPILIVVILYSIILYHAILKVVQFKKATQEHSPENGHKKLRMFRGRPLPDPPTGEEQSEPAPKGFFAKIFKKKPTDTVRTPSKWKAIKVVMFTTGSFIITWSPYFIASIVYVYQCEDIDTKRCKNLRIVIASPLAILGFTNSLINPIIYAWWHKGFRTYVQKRVNTVMMRTRLKNNSVNASNSNKTTSSSGNSKSIGNKSSTVAEESSASK